MNGPTMTQAVMTEADRNVVVLGAFALNEQVREMERTVDLFRENASEDQKEIVAGLTHVSDLLNFELGDHILDLVKANLGPQQQANLMTVLQRTGQWLKEERAALQPKDFLGLRVAPSPKDARTLRDLNYFETFLRSLARDILRMMADHNFRQSRTQCGP